jgi:hypothetical protein
MLVLAALAATVAHAPVNDERPRARVSVEATATVRIISGVHLKLDSTTNKDAPPARDSVVTADGTPRKARLIEFE